MNDSAIASAINGLAMTIEQAASRVAAALYETALRCAKCEGEGTVIGTGIANEGLKRECSACRGRGY